MKKCPKKWKKSIIFLPLPRMFWTFLNLGKVGNLMGTPPKKKSICLKHLKLPKNHFKTKGSLQIE